MPKGRTGPPYSWNVVMNRDPDFGKWIDEHVIKSPDADACGPEIIRSLLAERRYLDEAGWKFGDNDVKVRLAAVAALAKQKDIDLIDNLLRDIRSKTGNPTKVKRKRDNVS